MNRAELLNKPKLRDNGMSNSSSNTQSSMNQVTDVYEHLKKLSRDELIAKARAASKLETRDVKKECEESLVNFIRHAWDVVEPGQPYVHGWHIDAIAMHLEATATGDINRLLINVPPGCMKSLATTVFFPAWLWGPKDQAHLRFLCVSHSQNLAVRDSTRMRRLVQSEWYKNLWGDRVVLTGDQNSKLKFETTKFGFREAAAAGSITGSRGDFVLCLPYDEIVQTEVGPLKIGDIVTKKIKVKVWSADPLIGKPELKNILDWKHNPGSLIVEVGFSDGSTIKCTPNHKIWTNDGWIEAQYLSQKNMLPGPFVFDVKNGFFTNTINFSKIRQTICRGKNFFNLVFCKFRHFCCLPSSVIIAFNSPFGKCRPSIATPYLLDGANFNSVLSGQYAGGFPAKSNFYSLFSGQYGPRSFFSQWESAVPFGIFNVLRSSPVFKVFQPSIAAITIFVSNLMSFWGCSDKGKHNNLVNEKLSRLPIFICIKSGITFSRRSFENFFRNRKKSAPVSWDDTRKTFDPAQITNAIKSFKAYNRFPVFVRKIGHAKETFCLTIEDHHTFYAGERNSILIANCDDPHSVEGAASEAMRNSTKEWFLEAVPTRLNNPKKSVIVVIKQRLHEEDVSGIILERNLGYEHLMLPMEFDPNRKCVTSIGFEDPRSEDGELLFQKRFPRDVVERDKLVMGPYAAAGQLQQAPAPRGGGIIKREWWQLYDDAEAQAQGMAGAHKYPMMDYVVASLDPAYTIKQENDPSALTIWGVWQKGGQSARRILGRSGEVVDYLDDRDTIPCLMLMHAWAKRLPIHGPDTDRIDGETEFEYKQRQQFNWGLVEWIIDSCNKYNVDTLLIESKGSGISVAQEIQRLNRTLTWNVQLINPGNADKVARAYAVQPIFSNGIVYAPDKTWADEVITEAEVFPKGRHDDRVDSTTQALKFLRERNLLQRPEDILVRIKDEVAYKSITKPVYDV